VLLSSAYHSLLFGGWFFLLELQMNLQSEVIFGSILARAFLDKNIHFSPCERTIEKSGIALKTM